MSVTLFAGEQSAPDRIFYEKFCTPLDFLLKAVVKWAMKTPQLYNVF